jgi:hypothetical protein
VCLERKKNLASSKVSPAHMTVGLVAQQKRYGEVDSADVQQSSRDFAAWGEKIVMLLVFTSFTSVLW